MPRRKTKSSDLQMRLTEVLYAIEELDDLVGQVSTDGGLDDNVTLFASIRSRQEQVKEISAKLAKLSDRMSYEVIPDIFARTNTVSPYNHISGKFTLSNRTTASIKEGLKDNAFGWLEDNGLGDIIIRTIPWQTLGATAADLIQEGRDLPPKLFDVKTRVYTSFTPKKGQ
jgi:hypothetical protein